MAEYTPSDIETLRGIAEGARRAGVKVHLTGGTLAALLDALATTEHRATRAEAQSAIRGRAVAIYRERAREAEARIRAVEDVLDSIDTSAEPALHDGFADIRRALDS